MGVKQLDYSCTSDTDEVRRWFYIALLWLFPLTQTSVLVLGRVLRGVTLALVLSTRQIDNDQHCRLDVRVVWSGTSERRRRCRWSCALLLPSRGLATRGLNMHH